MQLVGHLMEIYRRLTVGANYAGTSFSTNLQAGNSSSPRKSSTSSPQTQEHAMATCVDDDYGVEDIDAVELDQGGPFDDPRPPVIRCTPSVRPRRTGAATQIAGRSIWCFSGCPNVSMKPGQETNQPGRHHRRQKYDGVLCERRREVTASMTSATTSSSANEMFWEVKGGKIDDGAPGPGGTNSNTPSFWKSCDMLGGSSTYQLGGAFSDGKGQPPRATQ